MNETSVRIDPAVGYDDDAELTTWLEPDGATVVADQPIAEVTASKALVEVSAPVAGRLRHAVHEGALLTPGQEIAVIEDTG